MIALSRCNTPPPFFFLALGECKTTKLSSILTLSVTKGISLSSSLIHVLIFLNIFSSFVKSSNLNNLKWNCLYIFPLELR